MKHLIIAAAITISGFIAGSAQAMPMASSPAAEGVVAGHVVTVDYPCGRGLHLNRRGRCVPNDRWDRPPHRWHRPPPRWGRPHHWDGPRGHWHRPPPPGYWRY